MDIDPWRGLRLDFRVSICNALFPKFSMGKPNRNRPQPNINCGLGVDPARKVGSQEKSQPCCGLEFL